MKKSILTIAITLGCLSVMAQSKTKAAVPTQVAKQTTAPAAKPKYVLLPENVYNLLLQYCYGFKELIPYSPNYEEAQKPGVEKSIMEALMHIQKNFVADTLKSK